MEHNGVKRITIEDIHAQLKDKSFCTKDILFSKLKSRDIDSRQDTVILQCMLLISCIKGTLQLRFNDIEYTLSNNDYAILIPGTTIYAYEHNKSHEYELQILGFSSDILRHILHKDKATWEILSALRHNPIIIKEHTNNLQIKHYHQILQHIISLENSRFRFEAINHIFSALLCEIFYSLSHLADTTSQQQGESFSPHAYELFRRFLQLVAEDFGQHRSVGYFAEQLCCTAQYLYKSIKAVSNKTPLEIIDSFVIEYIKDELRLSDMSIKEIAAKFNFATPSFFGTYFKKRIGITPYQYRKQAKSEVAYSAL